MAEIEIKRKHQVDAVSRLITLIEIQDDDLEPFGATSHGSDGFCISEGYLMDTFI